MFIAGSAASNEISETLTLWQDNFAVERDLIAHAERWLAIREQKRNLDPLPIKLALQDAGDYIIRRTSERGPTLPACHAVRSFVADFKSHYLEASAENKAPPLQEQEEEECRALLVRLIELLKLSLMRYEDRQTEILRSVVLLVSKENGPKTKLDRC